MTYPVPPNKFSVFQAERTIIDGTHVRRHLIYKAERGADAMWPANRTTIAPTTCGAVLVAVLRIRIIFIWIQIYRYKILFVFEYELTYFFLPKFPFNCLKHDLMYRIQYSITIKSF
jgi:hypothetical protein